MKKLFLTFTMLLSIAAIGLFAACGTEPEPEEDDTNKISVTYTFVIDEETVAFTAKQEENSALSYTYNLVEYEDVWYSDAECTEAVTTVAGEDMTVYTTAEDIYVRVIFQSELGNSNDEFAMRKGAIAPVSGNKVGYDFAGWSYGGNLYAAGETIPLDDAAGVVTVKATFTIQSYSVTYKSEGQADEVLTQEYGSAVAGAPTRKGYNFAGWFDQEDNEVTTIEGAITLTAKWNKKQYTVSVNGEEGVYEWGDQIPLNEIPREGYDYLGWQKRVGGGALTDISGSSYLVGNDDDYEALSVVLTPKYVGQPRTVAIVGGTSDSATVIVGSNLYESLKAYEPAGFSGWFYNEERTEVLQKDDTMTPSTTMTVYATTGRTYTVTFVNGTDEREEALDFNTEFTSEYDAEKAGHTFNGWYTAAEGGERVTGVWAEDITVYAQFTINTYVVNFDRTFGEGFIDDIVVEYGTEITIPDSTGMTKSNADFLYWEDEENNPYYPGDPYVVLDNVTFYAVWDVTLVTITLNDWDGYTIWHGEVEAGMPFNAAHDKLQLWSNINEFDGFAYKGKLDIGDYTLRDGDVIDDTVLEIVATAVYVNRYTNQVLQFPRVSNLVFALRDDAGHANEYLISGKEGTLSTNPNKANLKNTFKGAALSKSLNLPSTYQGKLVTGISAAQEHYYGAFSIAFPSSTSNTYDPTPYQITESVYIPSCYSFIGRWSFAAQKFKTLYIGQDSGITQLLAYNSLTGSGGAGVSGSIERVYGFPDNITRIEEYGFCGSSKPNDPDSFIVYDDEGKRITELPSSITYLGSRALSGVDIFRKVDLSNVTYIGAYLFDGKVALEELIIGNKITSIPECAFRACTSLRAVHIPAQVTSIGKDAFMIYQGYEGSLSSLTFAQNSKLKTIASRAFFRCPIESLSLPEGLEEIGDAAFAANTIYEGSSMSGNKYYPDLLPMHFLQLPNSLKSIGTYAFASTNIPEIKWGSGLQTIGEYAFYDTPSLKYLTIPDSVKQIGEGAFKKRYTFEYTEGDYFTLTLGGNLETVGKYAFQNFGNINHLTFAADSVLKRLESYAFANCLNLTGELILPSKLEYIGGYVFVFTGTGIVANSNSPDSAKFTKIFIPASVKQIDFGGFMYMSSMKEVEFEDNQTEGASLLISGNVFAYCDGLTSIAFPCQLTRMQGATLSDRNPTTGEPYYSGAVAYCKNLTTVIFRGRADGGDSALNIVSCTFEGCTKITAVYIGRDTEIVVENTTGSVVAEVNGTGTSMLLRHSKGFKLYVISDMLTVYKTSLNRWCSAAGGTGKVYKWTTT